MDLHSCEKLLHQPEEILQIELRFGKLNNSIERIRYFHSFYCLQEFDLVKYFSTKQTVK